MKSNEGPADRVLRSIVGIPLLAGGVAFYPLVPHPAFLVAAGVGAVLALTGIFGVCPLYSVLGINTDVRHGGAAPSV
jgi:Protein of unknown function (DUF2892).